MNETSTKHLCTVLRPSGSFRIFHPISFHMETADQGKPVSHTSRAGTHIHPPAGESPGQYRNHITRSQTPCVTIKPTAQEEHLNFYNHVTGREVPLCLTQATKVPSKINYHLPIQTKERSSYSGILSIWASL